MASAFYKILNFFIIKIIIGIALIVGLIIMVEQIRNLVPAHGDINADFKNIFFSLADAGVAVAGYVLLFKLLENRKIKELELTSLVNNSIPGFFTGLSLQSAFVLVIYLTGHYTVTKINPVSALIPGLSASITSGFVAEILIVGVFFRLVEEKFGTVITLLITAVLFAIFHINAKGATLLSIAATGIEAGFLLPASYVCTRKLWFPIFLHLAWDFAEPGIFGGLNPGISISRYLLESNISGPSAISGGVTGPQNSIQGLVFCLATGLLLLWIASRNHNFIKSAHFHLPDLGRMTGRGR